MQRSFTIPATRCANHCRRRPPLAWIREPLGPFRRADPERSQEAGDDGQPRIGHRVAHMAARAEQDHAAQINAAGASTAYSSTPSASTRATASRLAQSRAPERPVVDGESAGGVRGGEDAEAGDDGAHRQPQREQRPPVDAGDVPDGEDVAEVGDDLAAEADGEPGSGPRPERRRRDACSPPCRRAPSPPRSRTRPRRAGSGSSSARTRAPPRVGASCAGSSSVPTGQRLLDPYRLRFKDRQPGLDRSPPVHLVDHVDTVVLPVGAGHPEEERRPAPEAEPPLALQRPARRRARRRARSKSTPSRCRTPLT